MEIGTQIMLARKRMGLTQAELAERLELSRVQITNIETGKTNTTIDQLKNIAWVLNTTFNIE